MTVFETLTVGPLEENCFLVGDADTREAVCIDPGAEGPRIVAAIERHGLSIKAVLLTHTHFDHVGGINDVMAATGAPLYAPDGEQEMLAMAPDMAAFWGYPIDDPPEPDQWIKAGRPLAFGGLAFDVIDVRGHSPAGVGFVTGAMVFPGDALFAGSVGRTDLPGGDAATLIDCIKRNLLTLAGETAVHPGHGPATTIGREAAINPFLRP